jgi:DNA-directed RNA polymerase subunit RPC12/RpoP
MAAGMENIVRLADYRKRRLRARRRPPAQEPGAMYYCLRCDGDEFKLQAAGSVHCAHCGALMRNLLVHGRPGEETPPQ